MERYFINNLSRQAINRLFILARDRGISRFRDKLRSVAEQAIPALVNQLQEHFDADTRREAVYTLGVIARQPRVTIPALTAALNDRASSVQIAAVNAVEHFGIEAIPPLITTLADNHPAEGHALWTVISILENLPSSPGVFRSAKPIFRAATPSLIRYLDKKYDSEILMRLCCRFQHFADVPPEAVTALVKLVDQLDSEIKAGGAARPEKREAARDHALKTLSIVRSQDSQVLRILRSALEWNSESARIAAAGALIRTYGEYGPTVQILRDHLTSETLFSKYDVVNVLANIGPIARPLIPHVLSSFGSNDGFDSSSTTRFIRKALKRIISTWDDAELNDFAPLFLLGLQFKKFVPAVVNHQWYLKIQKHQLRSKNRTERRTTHHASEARICAANA